MQIEPRIDLRKQCFVFALKSTARMQMIGKARSIFWIEDDPAGDGIRPSRKRCQISGNPVRADTAVCIGGQEDPIVMTAFRKPFRSRLHGYSSRPARGRVRVVTLDNAYSPRCRDIASHDLVGAVGAVVQEQHDPEHPELQSDLGDESIETGGNPVALIADRYSHDDPRAVVGFLPRPQRLFSLLVHARDSTR